MSAIKDQAIDLIRAMPDDCTLGDIQYHLQVYEEVQRGIRDVQEGCVVSQAEAEQRVRTWLKSQSQSQSSRELAEFRDLDIELAAMAADPDIQRELRAIEVEFSYAEADGLERN